MVDKTFEVLARGNSRGGESHIALAAVTPGKYRLKIKDAPKEVILISDGETTWAYAPKLKSYTKQQVAFSEATGEPEEEGSDIVYRTLDRYAPVAAMEKGRADKSGPRKVGLLCRSIALAERPARGELNKMEAEFKTTTNWQDAQADFVPDSDPFAFTPPPDAKEVPTLNLPGERPMLTRKIASDFALQGLDGNSIQLSQLRRQHRPAGFLGHLVSTLP